MKTSLLTVLAAVVFGVLTAGSCIMQGGIHVVGSKNYITKEVTVGHFSRIKLLCSADVSYSQDTCRHIEIYGSDNIVPLVETNVDGGTLVVKFKNGAGIRNGKLNIKVSAPELNKLTINGSGDVNFVNGLQSSEDIDLHISGSGNIQGEEFRCRKMNISINGSGDVVLQQIESEACRTKISGSGDVSLDGKVVRAEYSISGSGDIRAADLQAETVAASISGSGSISCCANQKLTTRVAGSGSISYKGNPCEVDAPRKNVRQIN